MSRQETINNVHGLFDEGYACSQSVLLPFSQRFGLDEHTSKRISSTFGGGMGRLREKCGHREHLGNAQIT
ncbi:MAG: C-GCAxxG-C-C family protein [Smithellaceae bacterium]